jgi:glycylpeptide N-tetradecanoyltransferase
MIRLHKLPDAPRLASSGLREAEEKDIKEMLALYTRFMSRYDMAPVMTLEEARHAFLSGRGKGEKVDGRREDQVLWTYVVEVFTSLPSRAGDVDLIESNWR